MRACLCVQCAFWCRFHLFAGCNSKNNTPLFYPFFRCRPHFFSFFLLLFLFYRCYNCFPNIISLPSVSRSHMRFVLDFPFGISAVNRIQFQQCNRFSEFYSHSLNRINMKIYGPKWCFTPFGDFIWATFVFLQKLQLLLFIFGNIKCEWMRENT